jgi:regulator of replication initiation timing
MQDPKAIKERFSSLEQRIQQFIELHEALKVNCQQLMTENKRLLAELEEERLRFKRLDEGYKNLKESELATTRQHVDRINLKINDLVSEIDKNIKLIEA